MKLIEDYKFNKEMFGTESSPLLLAQAVRVYRANQRQGHQATKTRSEVQGTNRKMYKQKGTGHARHSDAKAPIFVGGGVAHGPKPRDYTLKLPSQAKKAAVKGALFLKNKAKQVMAVSGLSKLTGKTRELAEFLKWKHVLIVTGKMMKNVNRAAGNIPGVRVLPVTDLNAYEVMRAGMILWDEEIDLKDEKEEVKKEKEISRPAKRATVKKVTKKKA